MHGDGTTTNTNDKILTVGRKNRLAHVTSNEQKTDYRHKDRMRR